MDTERLMMIKSSCDKIRQTLGLKDDPTIDFRIRKFRRRYDKYIIEKSKGGIIDPPETLRDHYPRFEKPVKEFKEEYFQLAHDTKKGSPYKIVVIEIITTINGLKIFAGYNMLLINQLKSGERYCAIVFVHVKEMFQSCGLMTLLKDLEIEEAAKHRIDYIQTYHTKSNPDFNGAIIPSLKRGFILFHGSSAGDEQYEDKGYVHLRYYLDRGNNVNVGVSFKDGKKFTSPRANLEIIRHLTRFEELPGREIKMIKEYNTQ